ncbi:hypothetical protein AB6A40_003400 [Gnathostoma spinigerum]|uniref:Phospholipid/glycerol acyltransferase domain-containing protein n=1 Tax=Gnathostoma spinigerum TaxID=75299 RepID=A0ABD6EH26_9BILA
MSPQLTHLLRPIVGIAFAVLIVVSSLFGSYIITLLVPLILFNRHRLWRKMMDRMISLWMVIPITFLEYIYGMDIRLTGDPIDASKPALVIMNHRTRLDWMYYWIILFKINPWLLTTSKISPKAELKYLPGAGYGMAANHFIFLERNMERDRIQMSRAIDYYSSVGDPYQILLFPEGTDKTAHTTKVSEEYAKKNGLPPLTEVLYPRSAGMIHLITQMRQHQYIDYIYDLTVAYPDNIVQSEVALILKGLAPKRVHCSIKRIDISCVPRNDQDIAKWINELWTEKDETLKRYYSLPIKERCFPLTPDGLIWEGPEDVIRKLFKVTAFTLYISVVVVWFYHLTFIPLVQMLLVWTVLLALFISYCYGGIDHLVFHRWKKSLASK